MLAPGFFDHVQRMGKLLRARLEELCRKHPAVLDSVRGLGLMVGLKCVVPNLEMVAALRDKGLLTVGAGDNVLRLLPPLIVEEKHIDEAVAIVDAVAAAWPKAAAQGAA
jgi:acetylornithine/N-succinyldiaminopimelate aminotransferase